MTTSPPAGDGETAEPADVEYRMVARWRRGYAADLDYETVTAGTSGDDRWYTTRTGPARTPVVLHDDETAARAQVGEWMTGQGWTEDV